MKYHMHRIMHRAIGSESIAVWEEFCFHQRFQNNSQAFLHDSVQHSRYAEWSLFPVAFLDIYPSGRLRLIILKCALHKTYQLIPVHL